MQRSCCSMRNESYQQLCPNVSSSFLELLPGQAHGQAHIHLRDKGKYSWGCEWESKWYCQNMSYSTKISFSSPLRVPKAFQLCEAYGLKTLLQCLNTEKFRFFYNSGAQKFLFSLKYVLIFFTQSMWLSLNITKFRKYMGLLYNIVWVYVVLAHKYKRC